ncbi:hypothetical protein [Mycobacterium sp.]|uniref:hypothetical protein n=1 Tax=Mycobacterium sp. TaxID=1785 RepID=UPI0025F68B53|nr:hypothetical protein [Mycobacterium sp.]
MTATATTNSGDYGLWLLATDSGGVELTGWVETAPTNSLSEGRSSTEYWPDYTICRDRQQLPTRIKELGLRLAAGSLLTDLDKDWTVYVTHPDLKALRAQLDNDRAARTG